jgi:hypothetical protein
MYVTGSITGKQIGRTMGGSLAGARTTGPGGVTSGIVVAVGSLGGGTGIVVVVVVGGGVVVVVDDGAVVVVDDGAVVVVDDGTCAAAGEAVKSGRDRAAASAHMPRSRVGRARCMVGKGAPGTSSHGRRSSSG